MKILAAAFGFLLAVIGALLVAIPSSVLEFGRSLLAPGLLYIAAAIRVIFGVALVWAAPGSRAPKFLRVLGALLVIAGVFTPLVGVERSAVILDWMLAQGTLFTRAWAAAAAVLGGFIVHAIVAPRKSAA